MLTRHDRWMTVSIVILVACGGALIVLVRAAQIAHVQF